MFYSCWDCHYPATVQPQRAELPGSGLASTPCACFTRSSVPKDDRTPHSCANRLCRVNHLSPGRVGGVPRRTGHLPINNFYETSSICAFLIAVLFLLAYSYPQVRSLRLIAHISTVLIGYAALILSAVASIYYLLQERSSNAKLSNRFPLSSRSTAG